MIEIVEQKEWHNHRLIKQQTLNTASGPTPFLTIFPLNIENNLPCIIAIHGRGGSKTDWLEFDGYTKGGNLVKALADCGYMVVAIDLYGHGGNQTETPVDYDDLVDNHWEIFFHRSLESIEEVMSELVKQGTVNQERMGFVSYSLGGHLGFWMANRNAGFKTMAICAPSVDKVLDDDYSIHNNISNLEAAIMLIAAEEDEYIPFADSKWLYELLPVRDKRFVSFRSGHSLPVNYVPMAVEWFRRWL